MEVRGPSRSGEVSNRAYQRTYKACLSCRQRKAKCDLGTDSEGLPVGPPCAKCRREQRECVFSEKRAWERKGKRGPSEDIVSPSRVRRRLSGTPRRSRDVPDDVLQVVDDGPVHDDDRHGDDFEGPQQPYIPEERRGRRHSTSTLANSMMRTVVSSGNDALNILFEAAAVHSQENKSNGSGAQTRNTQTSTAQASDVDNSGDQSHFMYAAEALAKAKRPVKLSLVSKEVLSVWESCRFVKMGWFTSREAVTLIDMFFKNMTPLSPILTNFYADHNNHRWLVTREPVLCCTLLMLSSRYHVLPGAGGESRNFFIHHRLWQHCQQLVVRLIFGQERSSHTRIRSIGTIEALLLMSEWHPRSLHFPPESDGWDADITLAPEPQESEASSAGRWLEDMIEPAKRSDQMSWMLLGSALSLAHELGIFELDDKNCDHSSVYEGLISDDQIKLRRQRVQRLLYVYINQLAWRIGCVSLMPQSLNHAIAGRQTSRALSQPGDEWLAFMDSWMDLTKLAKSVTDTFFPTVSFARQQLHSGRYIDLLDHFRTLLIRWKEEHLRPQVLSRHFFDILFIEYHFVRVYTHSVGMQAVVERAVADSDPNVEDVRATSIDPIDYEYIQEVIDGCCQILQKVAQLGEIGALRFSPVRIFLRVTSSSIFLMKALSLGTRPAKLCESLDILDRCVQALKSNALDDIHLSSRYAALLEMHVSRLRRNLFASSRSTKHSYRPTTQQSMAPSHSMDNDNGPMMDVPVSQHMADVSFIPSLSGVAADDWLSLPFDPSMAPFGISTGGQFPAYEGGALNFIWNLPS
ncbi:C6 transcription factor [Aspergillus sclerotioniger CBS 115572]|uniref:C6 transcription factor n=1 Tax=Aspergillus sclerotioniger CBS 115572 TaxID=1450535 RepID=A0A317WZW0_9EURO|nr:C6 transcription factor [Aspergillus sclerotioniger CBS 115572]PWY91903.1 C6 transcription factor [Aspergillus sclerotioniger CBS 115572]